MPVKNWIQAQKGSLPHFCLWGLVLLASVALADTASSPSDSTGTEHVSVQLLTEHNTFSPGTESTVALKITHQPGWYTYWRTPGDSGMPTTVAWSTPPGIEVGDPQWPAPQRLPYGPFVNFGYEGEAWLLADIKVSPGFQADSATLQANVEWLVCKDLCIPESGEVQLVIPVVHDGSKPVVGASPAAEAFIAARALLPQKVGEWNVSARNADSAIELQIETPSHLSIGEMAFFPYQEGVIEPSAVQTLSREEDSYALRIPMAEPLAENSKLAGVIVAKTTDSDKTVAWEVKTPLLSDASDAGGNSTASITLITALLFAFAGGIILNLMPCVLPILSIKVLSFVQDDPRSARRNALFYGLGVVLSFWLLASVLLVLKAAGQQLGWGFQLQSPLVVTALAVLFFVLALNLAGFLELRSVLPARLGNARMRNPTHEAIWSGVLAVAVASPCTGPFMGAALGFAMTQSPSTTLAVFTALGVGFALPYMLLAWFPQARNRLPQPGAWMEKFRQFLAFPMLGTVVWLGWVLGIQAGVTATTALLTLLLLILLILWTVRNFRGSSYSRISVAVLVFLMLLPIGQIWGEGKGGASGSSAAVGQQWKSFSAAAVRNANAEDRTVFVDFTAAWCITCQVNKALVLDTPHTAKLFETTNTLALRADWTRRDLHITRALQDLGRSGVPAYLIQRPGRPPDLLPEILTKELLTEALQHDTHNPKSNQNPNRKD